MKPYLVKGLSHGNRSTWQATKKSRANSTPGVSASLSQFRTLHSGIQSEGSGYTAVERRNSPFFPRVFFTTQKVLKAKEGKEEKKTLPGAITIVCQFAIAKQEPSLIKV